VPGSPPDFYHYASTETAKKELGAAGFGAVSSMVVPAAGSFREAGDLYELFATATARSRATIEAQTDDAKAAIKAAMAEEVASTYHGTWQGRLDTVKGTWDASKAMSTGDPTGFWKDYPGAQEKIHVVKEFGAAYGGPAAGTQWYGGRFKYCVPFACVVVSATKK